jgi:hypothetical protein
VEWRLERAKSKRLPAMTEAGPMGLGIYLKLGFQQIGTWKERRRELYGVSSAEVGSRGY